MSFCVYTKVVRSPVFDHGHDEESRNGRDINIDILEAYIWTSEWFRVVWAFFRSTGRLPEPPREYMALLGLSGIEEREGKRGRRAPQAQSKLGRGPGPLSFLPLSSFLPLLLLLGRSPTSTRKGGNPTPGGSRTPLGHAIERADPPPPLLLFIRGRGAPHGHTS